MTWTALETDEDLNMTNEQLAVVLGLMKQRLDSGIKSCREDLQLDAPGACEEKTDILGNSYLHFPMLQPLFELSGDIGEQIKALAPSKD
jgi:hypothetical protein